MLALPCCCFLRSRCLLDVLVRGNQAKPGIQSLHILRTSAESAVEDHMACSEETFDESGRIGVSLRLKVLPIPKERLE